MKRKGMKKKAENDQKALDRAKREKSPDKIRQLRHLVKNWIMSFLYCKENIKKTKKDSDKNIQQHFLRQL